MPTTMSPDVTFVNVKVKFRNVMRCHKTLSNFRTLPKVAMIYGSFPSSSEEQIYNSRSIDYLSKWVEAKALPTNDARVVCKFLKSLFARFGAPRAIISDRGTHFCNDQFAKVMLKYGVSHRPLHRVSSTNKWTMLKYPIDDCPDCEDSRALSFVFHPQKFHILSFILGIQGEKKRVNLYLLRDGLAECEDECRGLSDESPKDDSDVVGGYKVDNGA
ncbi:reverse transcriptase domain-containing protein [Tanacetum coccineum]